MSLATDIMRKHGNISPPSKRKAHVTYKADMHLARIPNVLQNMTGTGAGRWRPFAYVGRRCIGLGDHEHPIRALMALKLFNHWRSCGFDVDTIPTGSLKRKRREIAD